MLQQHDWYYPVLERSLEVGVTAECIVHLFRSIPPDLEGALKEILRSFQILKASACTQSDSIGNPNNLPIPDSSVGLLEDEVWQHCDDCGYIRFEWDPETQRRKHVSMNPAFARMHGLHIEEMLTRCANRELHLGSVNEIEFLCSTLFDVLAAGSRTVKRYMRVATFNGSPFLVRCDSTKHFDCAGRITQVRAHNCQDESRRFCWIAMSGRSVVHPHTSAMHISQ